MKKSICITGVLVFACLLGCASYKEQDFRPWNSDSTTWSHQVLNGVHFLMPNELPRVQMNPEIYAFCLSGFKSDGYLPGPYVPSEAVYICCRPEGLKGKGDMQRYLKAIQEEKGVIRPIAGRLNGYNYWLPADYHNKNNSKGLTNDSFIMYVRWGFLISLNENRLCELYLEKRCNRNYSEINIDEVIVAEEKHLVEDILKSITN